MGVKTPALILAALVLAGDQDAVRLLLKKLLRQNKTDRGRGAGDWPAQLSLN